MLWIIGTSKPGKYFLLMQSAESVLLEAQIDSTTRAVAASQKFRGSVLVLERTWSEWIGRDRVFYDKWERAKVLCAMTDGSTPDYSGDRLHDMPIYRGPSSGISKLLDCGSFCWYATV